MIPGIGVAERTRHGPTHRRPALRRPQPPQGAAVHRHRRAVDGLRHRGQHGRLHARRPGRLADASGRAARRAGTGQRPGHRKLRRRHGRRHRAVVRHVSRSPGPQPGLCRHVLPDANRPDDHLRRAQRAGQRRTGFGHVLSTTRHSARGRTPVQPIRRPSGRRASSGGARLQLLDVTFCRRPLHRRQGDHGERPSARDHRDRAEGV